MLQITRILLSVAAGMGGLLLLLVLCTPKEVHRRHYNDVKKQIREIIGPHALFFKWNAGITLGLFLLGQTCSLLGNVFGWQKLANFGNSCYGFCLLSSLGFVWILKLKAEAHQDYQIGQALFGPRTMTKIEISNNFGNVAAGNSGPVDQNSRVDSIVLHKHIDSLINAVLKSGNELTAPQKRDAVERLNILTDQLAKPAAQREPSKIQAALKLLPGMLSSVASLAEAWSKLEPWINSHLQ